MPTIERSIEIRAPVARVFGILTDPGRLPEWFPFIAAVEDVSGTGAGATFGWTGSGLTGTGLVQRAIVNGVVDIHIALDEHHERHRFELQPRHGLLGGDNTRVRYALAAEPTGGVAGRFQAEETAAGDGSPATTGDEPGTPGTVTLTQALQRLKELAEQPG
jgi:uncharacterized protein YndB with AHSA1/START domain